MNRLPRRVSALLAALASVALGAVVIASQTDAARPGDITLTGTASTDAAGDAIAYAFEVVNTSGPTLSDVTVNGITFSGAGTQPGITCPQSSLPAGVTEICTASYELTAIDMSADTITYTATVSGTDSSGATVTGPSSSAAFSVQHPTFIDSPDITNDDIGDLSKLPGGAAVIQAYGNSWNQAMENSVDWAYDTIAAYKPVNYLISGDLTEGRWGEPGDASDLFGPQSDPATRIQNMATFYHGENVQRLKNAGLFDKLYAIPGDHDYGDNWWHVDDPTGYGKIKYDNFDIWRNSFYEHYLTNADGSPRFSNRPVGTQWDKTAYATMISPDMLLVSVDEFDRLANTDNVGNKVGVEVAGGQLTWFKNVLAQARAEGSPVKWIVVQGHVPAITPVRVSHSSGLHLAGPTGNFWQAMKQYKVNLYLAGEVHATSRRSLDGITQITTGSPLSYTGNTTFIAVHEYSDHLGLVDWGWDVPLNAPNDPSWDGACGVREIEANKDACPPGRVVPMNYDYTGYEPTVKGTLSIKANNTADYGTGNLIEYVNPPAPTPVARHAAISLDNTVPPASVTAAGQQVTYSFRLSNTGNVALSNVTENQIAFSGRGVPPAITCPQDTLPVGVSETCTATYTSIQADIEAGTAITSTTVAGGESPVGDAVSSNASKVRTSVAQRPSLSLNEKAGVASVNRAGQKITYSFVVKNNGNLRMNYLKVSASFSGTGSRSTFSYPTKTLAPGASTRVTVIYTVAKTDITAGKPIVSTSIVSGRRFPSIGNATTSKRSSVSVAVR